MVVLSGPPASGTSTWEAGHFDAEQVARTDTLRGVVATHEAAARVERLRPPDVDPDRYAARVNAGTVDDHGGVPIARAPASGRRS